VQEWLNRQGYFTIRGIKVDVHEIDLLATIRPSQRERPCMPTPWGASVDSAGQLHHPSARGDDDMWRW
jgi:hypothetical protein